MKNFLIAFSVFLVWSFFGLWLYSWLQPSAELTKRNSEIAASNVDSADVETTEPLKLDVSDDMSAAQVDTLNLIENEEKTEDVSALDKGLKAITQDGDVVFLYSKGISFNRNSTDVNIADDLVDFKYKVNTYLIEHPDEEIHISSLYSASENIESPNLGMQRGEKVKNILMAAGIPSEKIVVKPAIRPIPFNEDGSFDNAISFYFQALDTERISNIKLDIPERKTIYPKFVNGDIFENEVLKELLVEVQNVLEANPNVKVQVIGFTDNIGNANDNYRLGLKYARQVRWYLVTKGKIDRKRVVAISQGESQSIASNKTERGRLLNRRIEIIYK